MGIVAEVILQYAAFELRTSSENSDGMYGRGYGMAEEDFEGPSFLDWIGLAVL